MFKISIILILALFGVRDVACASQEDLVMRASDALSLDLKAFVKIEQKSVTIYNYSRISTGDGHATPTDFKNRIMHKISATHAALKNLKSRTEYKTSAGTSFGIDGFYAAIDPIESANYGGRSTDWRLLEIKLPPNFKYLEIGTSKSEDSPDLLERALSPATLQAISTAGCAETSSELIFFSPSSQACAQIAEATYQKLGFEALLYPFGSGIKDLCPGQPYSAFLFFGSESMSNAEIKEYSAESLQDSNSTNDLRRIASLFFYSDQNHESHRLAISRIWTGVEPLSNEEISVWVRRHLFSCQIGDADNIDTGSLKPLSDWR